jgi:hypothetical protein
MLKASRFFCVWGSLVCCTVAARRLHHESQPSEPSIVTSDEQPVHDQDPWALAEVAPRPDEAPIGPIVPSWCEGLPARLYEGSDLRFAATAVRLMVERPDGIFRHSRDAATIACVDPEDPHVQAQVGYLVQYWVNLTGAPSAQVVDYLTRLVDVDAYQAAQSEHCAGIAAEGDERRALEVAYGCPDQPPHLTQRGEVGAKVEDDVALDSEVARAQRVVECLTGWGDHARCLGDRMPLSEARLERELAGVGGWARAVARLHHAQARRAQKVESP